MSEWIKCSERLPEIDTPVLWLDSKNTMRYKSPCHIDELNKFGDCVYNYLHNYTHWMPLPAPPEAE